MFKVKTDPAAGAFVTKVPTLPSEQMPGAFNGFPKMAGASKSKDSMRLVVDVAVADV